MNSELSRVKSRRKERDGGRAEAVRTDTARTAPQEEPVTLSRVQRHGGRKQAPTREAGRTAGRGRRSPAPGEEEERAPSRTETHASDKIRFSKIFVNTLYALFFMLLVFLLYWGLRGAPPLRELW